MTNLKETNMIDRDEIAGSNGHRTMWVIVSGLGIVMTAGAVAGYLAAHEAQGGGALGTAGIVTLCGFAAIIIGLAYAIWRNVSKMKASNEGLTRREKLNRKIVWGCGLAGGAIGLFLAFYETSVGNSDTGPALIFADSPMPPVIALILAFFWAVIMPIIAWFWHKRAIDEQEASAYRDGGYYAAYAFMIGAPTWWMLWRGGLAPEPDGVAIFMLFASLWTAVWFWKKYR
jgi:uncharacterized membrane protein YidH (DUF202 family)